MKFYVFYIYLFLFASCKDLKLINKEDKGGKSNYSNSQVDASCVVNIYCICFNSDSGGCLMGHINVESLENAEYLLFSSNDSAITTRLLDLVKLEKLDLAGIGDDFDSRLIIVFEYDNQKHYYSIVNEETIIYDDHYEGSPENSIN